jgi:hypothetical protein
LEAEKRIARKQKAKHLCVFFDSRKAPSMAVKQIDNRKRQIAMSWLMMS